jgi:hypothetical protein
MLTLVLILGMSLTGQSDDLAPSVRRHISAAAQPWAIKNSRKLRKLAGRRYLEVLFEIEVNRQGGFTAAKLSLSSGNQKLDRLTRKLFSVLPRLRKLPAWVKGRKQNSLCVVHLSVRGKPRSVEASVACMGHGAQTDFSKPEHLSFIGPTKHLFEGWRLDNAGDNLQALRQFQTANHVAPKWKLGALSLGLMLGRLGRYDEAKTYLKYGSKGRTMLSETKHYLQGQSFQSDDDLFSDDMGDELEVVACQRDEMELFGHIRRRFSRLNRCVDLETERKPNSPFPSPLPIGFVITTAGVVQNIRVEHRYFKKGPFLKCVQEALKAKLKAKGGSDCVANFNIDIN